MNVIQKRNIDIDLTTDYDWEILKNIVVELSAAIKKLHKNSNKKILIIPPDYTRRGSFSGEITTLLYSLLNEKIGAVLPATGTHVPVTNDERKDMFAGVPAELFVAHRWKYDVITLGAVPQKKVMEYSYGTYNKEWPIQVNKLLVEGNFDCIVSIGQVVPHEVVGMSNYSKNIFIGTGGPEAIHHSHYLSALYGIEKIIGNLDTPVRKIMDYAEQMELLKTPVFHILTVVGADRDSGISEKQKLKGIFAGTKRPCFELAAEYSQKINIINTKPYNHVVAYLDAKRYKSTWLANKGIYRARSIVKDGGKLTVIAPGVMKFGEDKEIDIVIRKLGYRGSKIVRKEVSNNATYQKCLSAAAHCIHGSSEERFTIEYAPGGISQTDIEKAGYSYVDENLAKKQLVPNSKKEGEYKHANGDTYYFIPEPAIGLWLPEESMGK